MSRDLPNSSPESGLSDTGPRGDFQTNQGGLRGHLTQHARLQAPSHFKSSKQSCLMETMELGHRGDLGQLTGQVMGTKPPLEMEMEMDRSLLMGLSGREGDSTGRKQLRSLVHSKGAGLGGGGRVSGSAHCPLRGRCLQLTGELSLLTQACELGHHPQRPCSTLRHPLPAAPSATGQGLWGACHASAILRSTLFGSI